MKKLIFVILISLVLVLSFGLIADLMKKDEPSFDLVSVPEKSRAEMIADDSITEDPVIISNIEEFMAIPNGSSRRYELASDIDLSQKQWRPVDFKGSLDGKGHTLSNISIDAYSLGLELSFDGNMKKYKTRFAGLFGVLDGATVKNLNIENISVNIITDSECIFTGLVAGYMNDSLIDNVRVCGKSYLKTNSKCFGIGGFAGYGNGMISNSCVNAQLICIDSNVKEKDEQFMGGAYAAGRIDLNNNEVVIDGYDSDHGYVHNGGLVGMYIHYDEDIKGSICENTVSGRIKFFEDNRDRRAYCEPYVGEMMSWNLEMNKNSNEFTRDEVFEYERDLLPEGF